LGFGKYGVLFVPELIGAFPPKSAFAREIEVVRKVAPLEEKKDFLLGETAAQRGKIFFLWGPPFPLFLAP